MAKKSIILALLCTTTAVSSVALPTILAANGTAGYIDMPSANMGEEGDASFTFYQSDIISGRRMQLQPTQTLSLGLEISEDANGIEDRSLDIKYQIYGGSGYYPAIAIGANDVFGLGPRSSEYIVATSQLTDDIDLSLGLGWGAMGTHNSLNDSSNRPAIDQHAFSTNHFFSGPAAGFAGVSWRTPIKGLSVSAEYSSLAWNDAVANGFDRGDVSYGVQYSPHDLVTFSAYSRNGDDVGFSVTLTGNPNKPLLSQKSPKGAATVVPRAALGTDTSTGWAQNAAVRKAIGQQIAQILEGEGYDIVAVKTEATEITIELRDNQTYVTPKLFGRINRILAAAAPGSVEYFSIILVNGDNLPTSKVRVARSNLETQAGRYDAGTRSFATAEITGATRVQGDDVYRIERKGSFSFGGGVKQADIYIDGEKTFGIAPFVSAKYKSTFGLSATADIRFNMLGDEEIVVDPSDIGNAVRSDGALYSKEWYTLDRLTVDYKAKFGRDVYARIGLGLLDSQYAGIDVEALYAPSGSRFAIGAEVAQVTKRVPGEAFELGDYETTTGQVTGYWDTGYKGLELSASYGRFLAEDWGGTLGVSRKFANGWEMSASLAASEYFFDSKDTTYLVPSFAVNIPLQWVFNTNSRYARKIKFASSDTDAAQRLGYGESLYGDVRNHDVSDYQLRWGGYWQ